MSGKPTSGTVGETVFTMMPYNEGRDFPGSVYTQAIAPAVRGCGLTSVLPGLQPIAGRITDQLIAQIQDSRLCVADLTGLNANVMYEVGFAHALNKPVILVTRDRLDNLPFDLLLHRAFSYSSTPVGLRRLREDLVRSIHDTLKLTELPSRLLQRMLVPNSLGSREGPYVVAACPLSRRDATGLDGWPGAPNTLSDHVGIRGLMQAFGLLYGLNLLPELVHPGDFTDEALATPAHLYCIGSSKANPWTRLMMQRFFERREPSLTFEGGAPPNGGIYVPVEVHRDGGLYTPNGWGRPERTERDFGLVIRGPNPRAPERLFMALAGRSALGTMAACLAVTDPQISQQLHDALGERDVDLQNHHDAWCAVVSIAAHKRGYPHGVDAESFEVVEVFRYGLT